jgi:hypothetical protein
MDRKAFTAYAKTLPPEQAEEVRFKEKIRKREPARDNDARIPSFAEVYEMYVERLRTERRAQTTITNAGLPLPALEAVALAPGPSQDGGRGWRVSRD